MDVFAQAEEMARRLSLVQSGDTDIRRLGECWVVAQQHRLADEIGVEVGDHQIVRRFLAALFETF